MHRRRRVPETPGQSPDLSSRSRYGYLPGDLDEKLNPWMQPIYDNLELLLSGGSSARTKRFSKSYQELINQECWQSSR